MYGFLLAYKSISFFLSCLNFSLARKTMAELLEPA